MSTWRFKHESDLPRRSPLQNILNKGPKPNHLYEKVVNHRKNNVEQISNRIVMNHGMIVMEDLSVKGLRSISKDRRMIKGYDDVSVGILRKRICDKAESAGRTIILVDPKGTSQICSNYQEMVDKDLHQRTYLPALWIQRGQRCQRSEEHALSCIIHPTTRSTGRTGHPLRYLIGRMAVREHIP